jgi:hypothetical protein
MNFLEALKSIAMSLNRLFQMSAIRQVNRMATAVLPLDGRDEGFYIPPYLAWQ